VIILFTCTIALAFTYFEYTLFGLLVMVVNFAFSVEDVQYFETKLVCYIVARVC